MDFFRPALIPSKSNKITKKYNAGFNVENSNLYAEYESDKSYDCVKFESELDSFLKSGEKTKSWTDYSAVIDKCKNNIEKWSEKNNCQVFSVSYSLTAIFAKK